MGEFEDETVAGPAEDEPVAEQPDSVQPVPDLQPAEKPAPEVALGAIQESLLLDEPGVAPSEIAPIMEPMSDPIEALTDTEEPEQSELFPASEAADAAMAAAASAYGGTDDDDLAAAIAASHEQVGIEGTLDDIAPGTTHSKPAEEIISDTGVRFGAPWWPFLIYLGVWFAFAAVAVWQFQQLAPGTVLYETQQYMLFVFGGLVLAATGLILILAVWLGSRVSPQRQRAGLLTSAFIKGAAFILVGMVVWWATFMALDYLRLGRMI